jgi:hypothetical protein
MSARRCWRWERRDSRRQRYYVVHLRQDLWGGLGSRLGGQRVTPLANLGDALPLVSACHRRRLAHGYRLVCGDLT